jgi:hypothetical protein
MAIENPGNPAQAPAPKQSKPNEQWALRAMSN